MSHNNLRKYLLSALAAFILLPAVKAQTNGNRADLVNKTWRILAMKCPDALSNSSDPDQYVHYYASLTLTPSNGQTVNYGSYVMVTRDQSENPIQKGTYSLITDDAGGTRLVLKPRKGDEVTYRVELVYAHHLTLINLGDDAKCKVSYAIAP